MMSSQYSYEMDGLSFEKYNLWPDWSSKNCDKYEEVAPIKKKAGVYAFTLCDEIVYVGSSINLFSRLQSHIAHIFSLGDKSKSRLELRKYHYLKKYISQVKFVVLKFCDNSISKRELEQIEYSYIEKHNPIFNVRRGDTFREWDGNEQNVDDFVNGNTFMDDLRSMIRLCKHPNGHSHGSAAGMEYLMRIMDTVGVEKFQDLKGKYVRVAIKGWGSSVKINGKGN